METGFEYYMMMVIFLILIPLGSFYAPWVVRSVIKYLDANYPRDQYPGLISISPKTLVRFTWLDTALGLLSMLALIASITIWQGAMKDPYTVVIFICYYMFFRMVLWIVFSIKGLRYLKSLKAPAQRSATLQGVKLTDYISPAVIAGSMTLTAAAFGLILWWYITDAGAHPAAIIINVFLAVSFTMKLIQVIRGPKFRRIDPYVSHSDLFKQRQMFLRVQYIGSFIWIPVLLFVVSPEWQIFTHAVSFSFFCTVLTGQALLSAWMMKRWVNNTDISVYRVEDSHDVESAVSPGQG